MKNKLRIIDAPKPVDAPLESITQSKIIKKLKSYGYIVVRNRSTNIAGWPDLTVYGPGKTCFFVEVKRRPEDKPTPIQLEVHASLRSIGFRVEVWDYTTIVGEYLKEK